MPDFVMGKRRPPELLTRLGVCHRHSDARGRCPQALGHQPFHVNAIFPLMSGRAKRRLRKGADHHGELFFAVKTRFAGALMFYCAYQAFAAAGAIRDSEGVAAIRLIASEFI